MNSVSYCVFRSNDFYTEAAELLKAERALFSVGADPVTAIKTDCTSESGKSPFVEIKNTV